MAKLKTLKFEPKDTISSLFDLKNGPYPTQISKTHSTDHGGEYRGYYPGNFNDQTGAYTGTWKPKSSQRGGRINGSHNGADIYTGYGAFPVETPILAATAGFLTNIFDAENPNDAGNRVAISTKIGKDRIDFRYGHLSRFARPSGAVKKGAVIGYAGCSGNADTAGECTEAGPCGLTSCHVHLITAVNNDYTNAPDPIAMLGWSLAYGAGEDDSKSCGQIRPDVETFKPKRTQGTLKGNFENNHKRSSRGRRVPLQKPFSDIHFDDSALLRSAVAAFENLKGRLQDTKITHSSAKTKFGVDLQNHMVTQWVGTLKNARTEPKTAQGRALEVLQAEIDLLNQNVDTVGLGGPTTRALLAAARAVWLLCGGAAIREGMSNRTAINIWTNSGYKKFRTKWKKRNNSPVRKHLKKVIIRRNSKQVTSRKSIAMRPHQCCVGVDGLAKLVASDHAQVAIHNTSLEIEITEYNVTGSHTAKSLDFGTVGLMQSIWPTTLAETFPKPKTGDPDPEAEARDFAMQVSVCLIKLSVAYSWAYRMRSALALANADDARRERAKSKLFEELQNLHDLIENTYNSFLSLEGLTIPQKKTRRILIGKVLQRLVIFNLTFLRAGERRSAEIEKTEPIGPKLAYLSFETPEM